MTLPDPSAPIDEALKALGLPPAEFVAVRTFGDLLTEIERGNVTDEALLRALGVESKKKGNADAD